MEGPDSRKMRFKVCVRIRPTSSENPNGVLKLEHRVIYMRDSKGNSNEYVFDRVFDGEARHPEVFPEVAAPLVEHVMQGYNACCFAYGQTGSGKSYSLYGKDTANLFATPGSAEHHEVGIVPRAFEMLAKATNHINRKADHAVATGVHSSHITRVKVFVSFMEIYLDQIRDLGAGAQAYLRTTMAAARPGGSASGEAHSNAGLGLNAFAAADGGVPSRAATAPLRDPSDYARTNLDVMEDSSGLTFVKDLTFIEVMGADDMLAILRSGYNMRTTSSMSDISSRAHTIFTISVAMYRGDQHPVTGRLHFIDLAGSERISAARFGVGEAHRQKETSAVAKSLVALGKVVHALSQGASTPPSSGPPSPMANGGGFSFGTASPHVPFRDSKLTRILRDSLTGQSQVVLLACLHPTLDNADETALSLQFAARCSPSFQPSVITTAANGLPRIVNGGPVSSGTTLAGGRGGGARRLSEGLEGLTPEELATQVMALKDELEVTHAHYQKLLEQVAGPAWRNDPGPLERAPAQDDGMNAFAAALSAFGKGGSGAPGGGHGGGGGGSAATAAHGASHGGGHGHSAASVAPGSTGLNVGVSGGITGIAGAGFPSGDGGDRDRRRSSMMGEPGGVRPSPGRGTSPSPAALAQAGGEVGRPHGAKSVSAAAQSSAAVNARVALLESQVRKLEAQLSQARSSAQQYEERLTARKEEMDLVRERMAGKEHAQFAEIKKLRAQVAELSKALDAERTDSVSKLEDARRRSEEECARLMKDIDALRSQLAQVTGSVSSLVEKHSAAIGAEKRQREAARKQAEQLMQQQATRGSEEHKAQVENIKQQSTYFLARQADQLGELKLQLDAAKAAHAAEKDALTAELEYLATYSERVTELVRRMESGVVPVQERGNGVKAFRLPHRDRPPRLESSRLSVLKERNAELAERLTALTAVASTATASPVNGASSISIGGGGGSLTPALPAVSSSTSLAGGSGPAPGGGTASGAASNGRPSGLGFGAGGGGAGGSSGPLGSSIDLDALRAQVEAELRAQVTAQVVGDISSDKTIQYIRELEGAVGRYRAELQSEKKRNSEMAVALRSVQRVQQRPESPINKAMAAHTPAGTWAHHTPARPAGLYAFRALKLAPHWGMGHSSPRLGLTGVSRPATAGIASLADASIASGVSVSGRPATSMAILTSGYRDNGIAIP
ncbi:hypothetical protein GPECTOR_7g1173 [Gonium pectorale]|uniref:Kinesin motor domain-containing protein n=1 Tax=Gonium pectorale TaxID=33097 RepID=A0A150GTW9_GONPE|nr:hypothetical protein GPECTOR_7g1173 [Gonium pectorale]|eukprot:KXZ53279.1 hypothetical protein GPECTOR_7g1173 [Gonium pectorale]